MSYKLEIYHILPHGWPLTCLAHYIIRADYLAAYIGAKHFKPAGGLFSETHIWLNNNVLAYRHLYGRYIYIWLNTVATRDLNAARWVGWK